MRGLRLLRKKWDGRLGALVRNARSELLISSPYVSQRGVELLLSHLSPFQKQTVRLTMLTNLSPGNVCQGSTDPTALKALETNSVSISLYHLPRLHAKAYIADDTAAIVTSANLTAGGLFVNYEYGCEITQQVTVGLIRQDINAYAELGAPVTTEELNKYCEVAGEVRAAFRSRLARASRAAITRFDRAFGVAADELLRLSTPIRN